MASVAPANETSGRASSESLIRAIGTLGLAASIVNITIGRGIFRLPSSVALTRSEWAGLGASLAAGTLV